MPIKIKYQDPKSTDFGPNDLVINTTNGTIFYKSDKSIFKLQGDNLNTSADIVNFGESSISASKGFFATPGLGNLKIETGEGIYKFIIEKPTLEIEGHILPKPTPAPLYDIGSPTNPFRDSYFSDSSMFFIKTGRGVGFSPIKNGFIIGNYRTFTDPNPLTRTSLTKDNIDDLKAGKTIQTSSKDLGEGDTEKTNIIRPEAIMHPNDDSTYSKYTTTGRVGQFVGGTLFFDQNRNGDNNYIALGATDTQIRLTGNTTSSGTIRGKEIHILNTAFKDDLESATEIFVPWNSTTESPNTTNLNTPFIAPCSGKLLKIKYKSNLDTSGGVNTATWRIRAVSAGNTINADNATILATATTTGPTTTSTATVDFTAVSQTEFAEDDYILISIEHSEDTGGETIYWVTAVFQLNYNTLGY